MGPDRPAAPPGNLSLLGMAVISGMLTIILVLPWATGKACPYTSTDIFTGTPLLPAMCVTLHWQHSPERKQDSHLSRKKDDFHHGSLPHVTSLVSRRSTLHFRDKQKRYSPSFFQSLDLLQTHVHRTNQLKPFLSTTLTPRCSKWMKSQGSKQEMGCQRGNLLLRAPSQPGKQVGLPLPSGRRETPTSLSWHGNIDLNM